MKLAPLTLLLVCAAPARADVAVPQPAKKPRWDLRCAALLEGAAKKAGLQGHATTYVVPLRHENGRPNQVRYAEYASHDVDVRVGEEPEPRPDEAWSQPDVLRGMTEIAFRRSHNRFAKIEGNGVLGAFREAADQCLQMGEPK